MHTRPSSRSLVILLVLALASLAVRCPKPSTIEIVEPASETVDACLGDVVVKLEGSFKFGSLEMFLNGEALTPEPDKGMGVGFYRADAIDFLAPENLLEVRALSHPESEPVVETLAFLYEPPVRAERITSEDQLITGPLAHSRVGDWLLENCTARFIVQDAPQRDMYSVGPFGGNLIDLERVGRPGLDNFIEIAPSLDVETVVNPQTVEIVNDGSDGQPAAIRTCGPDDLLDFINPSSQISGLPGVMIPAHADDKDLPIEACTTYSLVAFSSAVKMDTTVTNLGRINFPLLVGDWINAGGEVENLFTPGAGPGAALTADLGAAAWIGYGEAAGVDYGFTTVPLPGMPSEASFFNTSGVTFSLHAIGIIEAVLGFPSPFLVRPGESRTFTRYLSVGDGSGSNAVDLAAAVRGTPVARVEGCVTVAGEPAPQARVVIGTLEDGDVADVHTLFTTDAAGCYAGTVPPTPAGDTYVMAAAKIGHLYEGGSPGPLLHPFTVAQDETAVLPAVDLPAPAVLEVKVLDDDFQRLPARVTVVGFDPSPEPIISGGSLFGLSLGDVGLFRDPNDSRPFGVTSAAYTDSRGIVRFEVEPGEYEIYVSRGTEYSIFHVRRTLTGGEREVVNAQIARVLDTPGFISSDYHVHGIHSADSRVPHTDRVLQYAGEGVENLIMTDHGVHTDLAPRIAEMGMSRWLTSTVGEEITSFDYGHFNGYPFTVDPTRPSGGSTDWAQAAPAGQDFPEYGAFNATPAEIEVLAKTGAQSLPTTAVQINHIDSYFQPLAIDTAITPIADGLDATQRLALRLPATGNLFNVFDGLELWNGDSRGAQSNFLDERMGIWFNHLNAGIPITFIADTDSHKVFNLNAAGARTWTPAQSDAPRWLDPLEIGTAIRAGRAVGGQGVYVQTRLHADDGSGAVADLSLYGATLVASATGDVSLEIDVQAPVWAAYDTIEIYANAQTVPTGPFLYSAVPTRVLTAGVDFTVDEVVVDPWIPGASRLETRGLVVPFEDLPEDTWFVVVVKGSDGVSEPMFPVYPASLAKASNATLDDLVDGNLGENGVLALGATNALYADVDGEPGFQPSP